MGDLELLLARDLLGAADVGSIQAVLHWQDR